MNFSNLALLWALATLKKGDFLTFLKADPDVSAKMTAAEIEENFDLGYHFKHVDTIFQRVFGQ